MTDTKPEMPRKGPRWGRVLLVASLALNLLVVGVFVGTWSSRPDKAERQVRDDLMPEKVKINPLVTASAFRTSKQLPVKRTSGREVMDGKSQMEGNHAPPLSMTMTFVIG